MKGRTYIMRRGRLVLKKRTEATATAPQVISDDLGQPLEHHGYADGRRTDSKSTFRRWTKEAGLVEKGNDRELRRPASRDLTADVAQAYKMVQQGYRPQLKRLDGIDG